MLKETLAADSLEEYMTTGTETIPKEIVAEPMVRAAIFPKRTEESLE